MEFIYGTYSGSVGSHWHTTCISFFYNCLPRCCFHFRLDWNQDKLCQLLINLWIFILVCVYALECYYILVYVVGKANCIKSYQTSIVLLKYLHRKLWCRWTVKGWYSFFFALDRYSWVQWGQLLRQHNDAWWFMELLHLTWE